MTVLRNVLRNVLSNPLADPLDRFGGFLPSQLTGLKAWFRFNSGITVTGAGVSQWDDVSGNGNHLLQATDTNRPSKEADGSILFDGVDNYLKCNAFTLNQPTTIYFLGKRITWIVNSRIYDGNINSSGALYDSGATPFISFYAGAGLPVLSYAVNTYGVLTVVSNGSNSILQLDSGAPKTGNAGTNNMRGFIIGAQGGGAANYSNIQVKEVVIYNEAHDAATRSQVIAYLSSL